MKPLVETQYITLFRDAPFRFESGDEMPRLVVAYETYGTLNASRDNAILICHALTGNAHAAFYHSRSDKTAGWWDGLIGTGGTGGGKAFDTEKFFVLCSSVLGGCSGTTGCSTLHPDTELPYGLDFPPVSIRDMVRVQAALADELGVHQFKAIAGGSMGGFQVLEWAAMFPERVQAIIPVSTSLEHSAWAIAHGHAQRSAIQCDETWNGGKYTVQPKGLEAARQMAMISYRSPKSFTGKFQRERTADDAQFQVESYLSYQGRKLLERFDANTYIRLTQAMDGHSLSRGRGTMEDVCKRITARTLSIGTSSDMLYPDDEQQRIAALIPNAEYAALESGFGHDAFLIEYPAMNALISKFLASR